MAKSKAARAALNTKHTRKRTTAKVTSGNRFDGLEVEEPYEYFRFMDLPRELRDHVLDNALTLAEYETPLPWHLAVPTMRIVVGKDGCRQLTTVKLGYQDRLQAWGALALLLVSKQIRKELVEAVARVATHHVLAPLRPLMKNGDRILFRQKTLDRFPVTMRRLYIKNGSYMLRELSSLKESVQHQLANEDGMARLKEYLRSCHSLKELVIDACTALSYYHPLRQDCVDVPQSALINAVEALPNLDKYAVRTCKRASYGSKAPKQRWSEAHCARALNSEWRKFLKDMGIALYDWA